MGQVNAVAARNGSPGGTPAPLRPGDAKLWKAAKDFQEVFLTQFTQAMRSSERDNEFFEECPGRETFDGMLNDALAHQMSEAGTLGLQKVIYRELGGAYVKSGAEPLSQVRVIPGGAAAGVQKAE
jgi:Rod binding domain-containing protein